MTAATTIFLNTLVRVYDTAQGDYYQTDRLMLDAGELLISEGHFRIVTPDGQEIAEIPIVAVERVSIPEVLRKKPGPPRAGASWKDGERAIVKHKYDDGVRIVDIAKMQERTPTAIKSELRRLGYDI